MVYKFDVRAIIRRGFFTMKDQNWRKHPTVEVETMVTDNVQYTITNFGRFAELLVYYWETHNSKNLHFFVEKFNKDINVNDRYSYWNCGDIETAISWAKHYAEVRGCDSMGRFKDDLGRFVYHLAEKTAS
jgi:hypothetical protein